MCIRDRLYRCVQSDILTWHSLPLLTEIRPLVSITPAEITVIDVPPSNRFTLTCTAILPSNSAATKVFTWSRRALGSGSSTEIIHNGGSVVIATSGDTSTLTTSETQSGGYVYNCSVQIGDSEPASARADVNVQGVVYVVTHCTCLFDFFSRDEEFGRVKQYVLRHYQPHCNCHNLEHSI